jgi:phytoene dehydrogenase-like protein
LAGLCCARALQRAGHTVQVYEASDGVGGRVRTDVVEGFRLDRGFQVLFTAYPAIQQEFDLPALRLRPFDPGALLLKDGRRETLIDPYRRPSQLLAMAAASFFGISDKLKIAKLRGLLTGLTIEEIFQLPDTTLETYLRDFGFSDEFLNNFIRPFYGGIFLERDLQTSARMFAFVFKMLAEGDTAVPEMGMGALGEQMAAALAPGTLHLNTAVEALIRQGERVTGLRLANGQRVEADVVVLATEADEAARLTGQEIPLVPRASTCLYFVVPKPLYPEPLLLLFADPDSLVNNAAQLTNVAPSYAPPGQHLLSATVLGIPELSDEALARRVMAELAGRFPEANPSEWRLLRVYRIRWSQYAQPAGVWQRLPKPQTAVPGLVLAGEMTVSSSLHGALVSGQQAAALVESAG